MSELVRPALIELPEELRGERVVLRPVRLEEADEVFAAIEESRVQLRPWMDWVDSQQSVEDMREQRVRAAAKWLLREELTLGIFEGESGRYLGGTGLHDLDWALRRFEIGYWLRTSATGRGYATEAVILLRDFAFSTLKARRLQLHCNARNDASRRVAERAGFVLEGRLRNAFLDVAGAPADRLAFSLIQEDWQLLRSTTGGCPMVTEFWSETPIGRGDAGVARGPEGHSRCHEQDCRPAPDRATRASPLQKAGSGVP